MTSKLKIDYRDLSQGFETSEPCFYLDPVTGLIHLYSGDEFSEGDLEYVKILPRNFDAPPNRPKRAL